MMSGDNVDTKVRPGSTKPHSTGLQPTGRSRPNGVTSNVQKSITALNNLETWNKRMQGLPTLWWSRMQMRRTTTCLLPTMQQWRNNLMFFVIGLKFRQWTQPQWPSALRGMMLFTWLIPRSTGSTRSPSSLVQLKHTLDIWNSLHWMTSSESCLVWRGPNASSTQSLAAIKNAIARELKGAVPVQLNVNPSKGDAFNDAVADEEILQWLLQAEEDCSASAGREVSPDVPFEGEEVILEAFDAGIVDSDDEELTCQAISAQAREEAQAKGLSTEEDNEWTKLSFEDAKPDEPDISEWEDTTGKVGVVSDEAPPEMKKGIQEVDLDDVVTESSMEVIEEGDDEEFVDAEEGTAEKDVEMGDDARGDPMPESMFSVVTDPGDPRSIANPKAVPEKKKEEEKPDPRSATNPKVMPEKKVQVKKKPAKEPKEKKIEANREVEPGTPRPDVPLKQLDPKTFMNAQDRVWLEPDNMAGVRLVRTDYGRYLAISKVMTAYLRGWKKYHGKPSPDFHPEDLSMEFWTLVQYLQRDIPRVTEREVLEVVKGSDTRRFRVMAENRMWGPLQWEPVRIRAIQGHCEAVVKQCSMKSLVRDLPWSRRRFGELREQEAYRQGQCGTPIFQVLSRVSPCPLPHLWLRGPQVNCNVRFGARRISAQDGKKSLLLQPNAPLGRRHEEVPRYAGREANRLSVWHRTLDADGLQVLSNRRSRALIGLGHEHGPHCRVWHAPGPVHLVQQGIWGQQTCVPEDAQRECGCQSNTEDKQVDDNRESCTSPIQYPWRPHPKRPNLGTGPSQNCGGWRPVGNWERGNGKRVFSGICDDPINGREVLEQTQRSQKQRPGQGQEGGEVWFRGHDLHRVGSDPRHPLSKPTLQNTSDWWLPPMPKMLPRDRYQHWCQSSYRSCPPGGDGPSSWSPIFNGDCWVPCYPKGKASGERNIQRSGQNSFRLRNIERTGQELQKASCEEGLHWHRWPPGKRLLLSFQLCEPESHTWCPHVLDPDCWLHVSATCEDQRPSARRSFDGRHQAGIHPRDRSEPYGTTVIAERDVHRPSRCLSDSWAICSLGSQIHQSTGGPVAYCHWMGWKWILARGRDGRPVGQGARDFRKGAMAQSRVKEVWWNRSHRRQRNAWASKNIWWNTYPWAECSNSRAIWSEPAFIISWRTICSFRKRQGQREGKRQRKATREPVWKIQPLGRVGLWKAGRKVWTWLSWIDWVARPLFFHLVLEQPTWMVLEMGLNQIHPNDPWWFAFALNMMID